jgi:glycosyltransferase involved in cell wall biosynthesis
LVKKGLLITPVFPPASFPESHLMAKLLSSLPNYEFDVVTFAGWKKWFGEDNSFEIVINENFGAVEYLKIPRILRWAPLGRFGLLGKLPDAYRFFNFLLFYKAKQMISENKYEVMVTWSQPHSSHIIGLQLKSSIERPPKWIAHFSDPWISNPYFEMKSWVKKVNENLLNRILSQADAISVTNEYVIVAEEGFTSAENLGKVHVVPHSYLSSMYPEKEIGSPSESIIIRYIGSFYGLRRPDPLLSVLALLEANDPDFAKKVQIEFIGSKLDERARREIEKLQLISVSVLPLVTFRESLSLMQSADLLLIIDAPMDTSPFLPSKLVDYIGSNVPILAFTPPGPSADVIEELGGWVAPPTETELGYQALKNALKTISSKGFIYAPPIRVVERYKSSENGKLLQEIIAQLF